MEWKVSIGVRCPELCPEHNLAALQSLPLQSVYMQHDGNVACKTHLPLTVEIHCAVVTARQRQCAFDDSNATKITAGTLPLPAAFYSS